MRAVAFCAPQFMPWARREVEALLPAGSAVDAAGPGLWLLSAPGRYADRVSDLAASVFLRHCCPVAVEVPAAAPLGPAAERAVRGARGPVAVHVTGCPRPGAVAAELRAGLERPGLATTGGPAPTVLSVVVAGDTAYLGAAPAAQHLSPWPGGVARLRRRPGEISRAARKLEEALLLFGVRPAPGGRALDLGAAPGGYTGLLLDRGMRVVAVDTAALSSRLADRPALTFVRGPAQRVALPAGPYDLLTADLSWDPLRAADCALRARPRLAPDAHGIFTVKFFGRDPLDTVARVRRRLEEGYRVVAVRHLFHDRAEATAHLRPLPVTGPAAPA